MEFEDADFSWASISCLLCSTYICSLRSQQIGYAILRRLMMFLPPTLLAAHRYARSKASLLRMNTVTENMAQDRTPDCLPRRYTSFRTRPSPPFV